MNCPYCGAPMEKGKIPVYDRTVEAYWLPEEENVPLVISKQGMEKRKGVVLTDSSVLGIPCVEAYICRACKKGIFEIPD